MKKTLLLLCLFVLLFSCGTNKQSSGSSQQANQKPAVTDKTSTQVVTALLAGGFWVTDGNIFAYNLDQNGWILLNLGYDTHVLLLSGGDATVTYQGNEYIFIYYREISGSKYHDLLSLYSDSQTITCFFDPLESGLIICDEEQLAVMEVLQQEYIDPILARTGLSEEDLLLEENYWHQYMQVQIGKMIEAARAPYVQIVDQLLAAGYQIDTSLSRITKYQDNYAISLLDIYQGDKRLEVTTVINNNAAALIAYYQDYTVYQEYQDGIAVPVCYVSLKEGALPPDLENLNPCDPSREEEIYAIMEMILDDTGLLWENFFLPESYIEIYLY